MAEWYREEHLGLEDIPAYMLIVPSIPEIDDQRYNVSEWEEAEDGCLIAPKGFEHLQSLIDNPDKF